MCMQTIEPEVALLQDIVAMQSNTSYNNTMENRVMRRRVHASNGSAAINGSYNKANLKRLSQRNEQPEYFTAEWMCAVAFLTASLLFLPLFLPPLPPPPFLLLFVPVVIMILLIFLAFMPYDVRNIASSYM